MTEKIVLARYSKRKNAKAVAELVQHVVKNRATISVKGTAIYAEIHDILLPAVVLQRVTMYMWNTHLALSR